ncbi:glucose-1-phosphate cytidylyltransferase [Clostridium gasigenes]|uniref:glucose-1-phosphate cytidylyltransferase n=1 Tax=Clostridium gasigenes TaxID=94869 RepID=UPI00162941E8|nr:glucose-1-phosphate cytidylyltransferase [Clostridium gasigenes]MBB6624725.1 glucose-1-phosphate cytidylyltransferase [Clostridium gasigenes]
MKVVILAGGFGTRISEESYLKPKPLIEIGEKPILWHIMKIYSHYGFNDFIICAGYKSNLIKDYFYKLQMYENDVTFNYVNKFNMEIHENNNKSNPWNVTVVDTGLNTMTGGRIKRIKDYIGEDEEFMITYGDGVANVNINELIKAHKSSGKIVTVTAIIPIGRFGVMKVENNLVKEFKEKVSAEDSWISGGFFIANKKIFDYLEEDSTVLEQYPLKTLAKENELGVYKHTGFWQPMDTMKEKEYLEGLWFNKNAPWKLWE